MKEPLAILLFAAVIYLGWEQPFGDRYEAFQHNIQALQALSALRPTIPANKGSSTDDLAVPDLNAPPENVPPEPDSSGGKNDVPSSWMWQKGKLDSRQQGVDRSSVHTVEPLMRN